MAKLTQEFLVRREIPITIDPPEREGSETIGMKVDNWISDTIRDGGVPHKVSVEFDAEDVHRIQEILAEDEVDRSYDKARPKTKTKPGRDRTAKF